MKKILLSGFVIVTFVGYAIHQRFDTEQVGVITPNFQISPTDTVTPKQLAGAFRDGTYTGPVTDAYYGPVQVKAIITGGKISDVQFLQYPNDRNTSIEINSQAMPMLKEEAIQAQSGQVDGVSGATQTSRAFIESLTAALAQAK